MNNRIIKKLINWLYQKNVIVTEDIELYEYSAYSVFITVVPIFAMVIFSIIIHKLLYFIALLIPFMCLRQYAGGFHAKNIKTCSVLSILTISLATVISSQVTINFIHWIIVVLSTVSLIINSPVESENSKYNMKTKMLYRWCVTKFVILFMLVEIVIQRSISEKYANAIGMGIVLAACAQIPCLLGRFASRQIKCNKGEAKTR